jgi:hypothetical protein
MHGGGGGSCEQLALRLPDYDDHGGRCHRSRGTTQNVAAAAAAAADDGIYAAWLRSAYTHTHARTHARTHGGR